MRQRQQRPQEEPGEAESRRSKPGASADEPARQRKEDAALEPSLGLRSLEHAQGWRVRSKKCCATTAPRQSEELLLLPLLPQLHLSLLLLQRWLLPLLSWLQLRWLAFAISVRKWCAGRLGSS